MPPAAAETLFDGPVPVRIKQYDRDEHTGSLRVELHSETAPTPNGARTLRVRVTDPEDPLFLHVLVLSEESFHDLKTEQALLVDFFQFPEHVKDMLGRCGGGGLLALLAVQSPTQSTLSLVEQTPFRNIVHLVLKLRPSSDEHIKQYLAECVVRLKTEGASLRGRLEMTTQTLSSEIRGLRETCDGLRTTNESLERDADKTHGELSAKHAMQQSELREAHARELSALQARMQEEREASALAHAQGTRDLQARLETVEAENARNASDLHKAELEVADLTRRLARAEHDLAAATADVTALRADNKTLDGVKHAGEKQINQERIERTALEQQLLAAQEMQQKMTLVIESANREKATLQEVVEANKATVATLTAKLRGAGDEIRKGNDIIYKLQLALKQSKVKVRAGVLALEQAQRELGQRDGRIHELELDVQGSRASEAALQADVARLEDKTKATEARLQESTHIIDKNEKVIAYLNTQVNEADLARRNPFGLASTSTVPGYRQRAAASFAGTVPRGMPPSSSVSPSPAAARVNKTTDGLPSRYLSTSAVGTPVLLAAGAPKDEQQES